MDLLHEALAHPPHVMRAPTEAQLAQLGDEAIWSGHAVLLVGYDTKRGWGPRTGPRPARRGCQADSITACCSSARVHAGTPASSAQAVQDPEQLGHGAQQWPERLLLHPLLVHGGPPAGQRLLDVQRPTLSSLMGPAERTVPWRWAVQSRQNVNSGSCLRQAPA